MGVGKGINNVTTSVTSAASSRVYANVFLSEIAMVLNSSGHVIFCWKLYIGWPFCLE